MLIKAQQLAKSFGSQTLFDNVSFQINAGERVGLVGANGAGKTTLLKIIMGDISADEGSITFAKDVTLGYLEQVETSVSQKALLDEVIDSQTHIKDLEQTISELQHTISREPQGPEQTAHLQELAAAQERFEVLDGYTLPAKAKTVLAGLGFSEADFAKRASEFSGGWLMRIRLAKLLLKKPDVLLLDEPTNHLDLVSVRWFEGFLQNYSGSILLVSHDRAFINAITTSIAALENKKLTLTRGNYDHYLKEREANVAQLIAKRAAQERDIQHMQTFVDRFRYKATKAKAAQMRIAKIEQIKSELVEVPEAHKQVHFAFKDPVRTGDPLVKATDVTFSYTDTPLYQGLDTAVYRGDKIALVGPNGSGKSTLMKLLAKRLDPQAGTVVWGKDVDVSYFAQHQLESLNQAHTVLQELEHAAPSWKTCEVRRLLGAFLFSGDACEKRVSVLSGGEQARLALAKMLVKPAPLLCLDEPTNHLDLASVGILEQALVQFKGSLILISHDEALVTKVANKVIEIDAGNTTTYDGDYAYYLSKLAEKNGGVARPSTTELNSCKVHQESRRGGTRKTKAQKRAEAELRNSMYRAQKETQEELGRVEKELEKHGKRYDELLKLMAKPDFYENRDEFEQAFVEYGQLKVLIEELEERWLAISERLEQD